MVNFRGIGKVTICGSIIDSGLRVYSIPIALVEKSKP
jgi:hypothetical protein